MHLLITQFYILPRPLSLSLPFKLVLSLMQTELSHTLNSDLVSISQWGTENLVKFIASNTQVMAISLSPTPSTFALTFENNEILPLNSINIAGVQVASNLSWMDHITKIAKSAFKKLSVLFRY